MASPRLKTVVPLKTACFLAGVSRRTGTLLIAQGKLRVRGRRRSRRGKPALLVNWGDLLHLAQKNKQPTWRRFMASCLKAGRDPDAVLWMLISGCKSDGQPDPDMLRHALWNILEGSQRLFLEALHGREFKPGAPYEVKTSAIPDPYVTDGERFAGRVVRGSEVGTACSHQLRLAKMIRSQAVPRDGWRRPRSFRASWRWAVDAFRRAQPSVRPILEVRKDKTFPAYQPAYCDGWKERAKWSYHSVLPLKLRPELRLPLRGILNKITPTLTEIRAGEVVATPLLHELTRALGEAARSLATDYHRMEDDRPDPLNAYAEDEAGLFGPAFVRIRKIVKRGGVKITEGQAVFLAKVWHELSNVQLTPAGDEVEKLSEDDKSEAQRGTLTVAMINAVFCSNRNVKRAEPEKVAAMAGPCAAEDLARWIKANWLDESDTLDEAIPLADLDLSKSDVRDAQAFASKQLHLDLSAVLRDPRATVGDLLAVARAASLV